jgi:hypothetical protein
MHRSMGLSLAMSFFLSFFAALPLQAQTKKWSDVDCTTLAIVLPGATKCRTTAPYAGPDGRSSYINQTASFANETERAYAYVAKPHVTLANGGIGVTAESREKFLSQPSTDAGKSGTNFSATLKVSNGYVKTFAMPGAWQSFSFAKDASPGGESYGFAFNLVGYDCKKSASVPDVNAMTGFIQNVSLKP